MSWFADSMINRPPRSDEIGLIVRPIFSGSDPGVLTVQFASGAFNLGAISGSFSTPQPNTGDLQAIPNSTSAVIIASGNLTRMGLTIFNESTGTLYLRCGTGAATNMFTVKLSAQDFWELQPPTYTGVVTGLWNVSDPAGNALVTEFTP
mgnify:CR=1 FL=1